MYYFHRVTETGHDPPPWCARILGNDPLYGFKREFVKAKRDYSGAKRRWRGTIGGLVSYYPLRVGWIVEVDWSPKCHRRDRYFARVTSGGLEHMGEPEVKGWFADRKLNPRKSPLGVDVLTAARERIAWIFDSFPRIYLSGPSGKDSGAMMHLACLEARRRKRKIGVLYIDLEAQYKLTIDHVREMFALYADVIEPHWVALPLHLRNAVSMAQPYWVSWDPEQRESWVRDPPAEACTDPEQYPFHKAPWTGEDGVRMAMEFEEFIEHFGHWYSGEKEATCCLVGIRADESLNRWRTIDKKRKSRIEDKCWTAWKGGSLVNAYPIYDWRTEDIWTYFGKERLPYNRLYDQMYKAGLSIHQMRICQPYGDDQRRGLNLYHVIEPETWARVVARVAGANSGALYAGKTGNILGNGKVTLPDGHTWQSFARMLLESLPEFEREHYENKIAVFMRWYAVKENVHVIPDDEDPVLAERFPRKGGPSWRRICKAILKNDRMCRTLGFSQHVSGTYERYRKLMVKRRTQWGT